jgi:DNA-binding MarR family transcriptional regulator
MSRAELLNQAASELGRNFSTETILLHEAISAKLDLTPAHTKCVGAIMRSGSDAVTAGYLAQELGLTTGAITGLVDRLVEKQVVERLRDEQDRRKVLIRVNRKKLARIAPFYESLGKSVRKLLSTYNDKELATIADFMGRAVELLREQRAEVEHSR